MSNETLPALPELHAWAQFLALAETLHFGRAAKRLGMTQPPLTQAIQKLEAQLGVLLFNRTRRTVALTPAGATLIEPARSLLQSARALPSMAKNMASGTAGVLRLGFVSTVGFEILPRWLRSFRECYPNVTVQLREATLDLQLAALAQGELDAAFVLHAKQALDPALLTLPRLTLGTEPLVIAAPSGAASTVRVDRTEEILLQPLIIFPRHSAPSLYDAILSLYHRHSATPTFAQEAIQMQTIINLVAAGLGIALVPEVVSKFRRRGVRYHPLPAGLAKGAPRCETSLAWNPAAPPVVSRFVEHIRHLRREG
jgi:DNA-binding transcriptional LysR family regulator